MKPQTQFLITVALTMLALSIALFAYWAKISEPERVFPATIDRDCAPWDGSAFTVSIPYDAASMITISIWKPPEFKISATFSLPDEEGQLGYAYIQSELDPPRPLNGKILFQRVGKGMPIEGRFSLTSERGETFAGRFIAEWGEQIALCG
jgi:hypothetical protein